MRARRDVGETLIEVLFTIVIVGLTFTALFTSLATAGNAGNVQRISVQTDVFMRNFAEATKAAAQGCVATKSYNVVYPAPLSDGTPVTLPAGFVATVSGIGAGKGTGTDSVCPDAGTTQLLTLTLTHPLGPPVTMQIKVITP